MKNFLICVTVFVCGCHVNMLMADDQIKRVTESVLGSDSEKQPAYSPATSGVAAESVVFNGDLEATSAQGELEIFRWFSGENQAAMSLEKEVVYSGEQSIRISCDIGFKPGCYSQLSQTIKLKSGTGYRLTFWAKADALERAWGGVDIKNAQGTFKRRSVNITAGTYDWKKFSYDFTADDPIKCVFSICIVGKAKNLWIDDIQLTVNSEKAELDEKYAADPAPLLMQKDKSWGYPDIKAADHLYCIKMADFSNKAEIAMIATLAGVVAKKEATIFIMQNSVGTKSANRRDELWLEEFVKLGHSYEMVTDPWDLVDKFKDQLKGAAYILYKMNDVSLNNANSLCGPFKAVAIDESIVEQAERHGLKRVLDVRGMTAEECFTKYRDKFSRRILGACPWDTDTKWWWSLRDYFTVADIFVYRDSEETQQFNNWLYRWYEGDAIVIGWGSLDEGEMVKSYNRPGLAFNCHNWQLSAPIFAGMKHHYTKKDFSKPKKKYSSLRWKKDTHYVMFHLSDGDNIGWHKGNFINNKKYWANPLRGKFPMSWGNITASYFTQPTVLKYELDKLKPTESFTAGLGANGYNYYDCFGTERGEKGEIWDLHLKRYNKILKFLDWQYIEVMASMGTFEDTDLSSFSENLEQVEGILWIAYSPYTLGKGKTRWIKNKSGMEIPVISAKYALWENTNMYNAGDADQMTKLIDGEIVPAGENEFSWLIAHAWSFTSGDYFSPLDELYKIQKNLAGKNIEFVEAEGFFMLLHLHKRPRQTLERYARDIRQKNASSIKSEDVTLLLSKANKLFDKKVYHRAFRMLQQAERLLAK